MPVDSCVSEVHATAVPDGPLAAQKRYSRSPNRGFSGRICPIRSLGTARGTNRRAHIGKQYAGGSIQIAGDRVILTTYRDPGTAPVSSVSFPSLTSRARLRLPVCTANPPGRLLAKSPQVTRRPLLEYLGWSQELSLSLLGDAPALVLMGVTSERASGHSCCS